MSFTSEGSFLSIHPQKGGSEPCQDCKDGSFPRSSLAVEPFARFASENVQIGWPTFENIWTGFKNTDQELIVFPRPGLSREGSAPWECRIALGSRRTGTTRGTSPRKSSTGDQTGRRTRIRPISGVEEPQNHKKGTPRKSNHL